MTSQRHTTPRAQRAHGSSATVSGDVLAATREAVLAVGVRRTTLTDVARRAGVSRMTLYRRVPDVDTLILAVIAADLAAVLTDAERQAEHLPNGRARLVSATTAAVRALGDDPILRRVLDVDPDVLLPYLTERVGTAQRLAAERVAGLLRAGMVDGSVRSGDADALARLLVLLVTPFVLARRTLDPDEREAALAELGTLVDRWLAP
jgi:AcrR family transcriptional regulator